MLSSRPSRNTPSYSPSCGCCPRSPIAGPTKLLLWAAILLVACAAAPPAGAASGTAAAVLRVALPPPPAVGGALPATGAHGQLPVRAVLLRDLGHPQLPAQRVTVLIPRDESVTDVSLAGGRVRPLAATADLPIEMGEVVEGVTAGQRIFNAETVAAAPLYPPVEARMIADQFLHGWHLVMVEVYPMRQDRATGALQVREGASLELTLGPRHDGVQIADRVRLIPGWRAGVEASLAAQLANPQALAGYDLPPMVEVDAATAATPNKTPSLSSSPVQMLIVTNDAMAPQFQRLADHRTKLGLPTIVVTVSQVLAQYRHGLDLAETLRMYITDAYSKWGVDYVLLGGDTDIIPARYANSTFYPPSGTTDIPADLYYAALTGNWNADGDAIFGEAFVSGLDLGDFVDFTPELAVGRAPVHTLAEAQVFVNKIFAYEIPASSAYQSRALAVSEALFPQDWVPPQAIQLDGATFSESILNNSIVLCAPQEAWTTARLYENYTAYPGALPETKQAVLDSANTRHFGLLIQEGHGFYFNMSVGDGNILVADADALTNAPNYFVLYALNCSSAAFDFNCLMERFVRNPIGGSVASLGSARAAFPNTANDYQQAFFNAVFCGGLPRLGDAVNQSRMNFTPDTFYNTSDRWTHFVYTLLGDPAMPMWTARPRAVSIAAPASVPLGNSTLAITVTDVAAAEPLEGATVCLSKGNEDYAVGTTDVTGTAQLNFHAETAGSIAVWISGKNARPTSAAIPVVAGAGAFLAVSGWSVSDDNAGVSSGNGNGRIEGAESIELTPLLRNSGTALAAAGTVVLTTTDPYLVVSDSVAAFAAVPAASSASAGDPFVFLVDQAVPDAHEATLVLRIESGASSWMEIEHLTIGAPEIEPLLLRVDDSVTGNNNGIADVNEDVDLILTLKNFGSSAVGSVTGTLISADPAVTIVDGSAAWGAMPTPLSTADNNGNRFRVRESTVSSSHQYDLSLLDDLGRSVVAQFDLRRPGLVTGLARGTGGVGEIVVKWSPNADADLLGYRVYRERTGESVFSVASADIIRGSSTFRDSGLPSLQRFQYYVVAVDNGRLEGPPSAILTASTSPPEICDFPLPMGQESSGSLAVHDVDGDGVLDMIIGSDKVYGIDGLCREKLDGDSNSQTFGPITGTAGKYTPAGIAIGDLGGPSTVPEIVASSWGTSELYVFDAMGSVLPGWPRLLQNKNWTTPALGDLDGDGKLEIVLNDVAGYTYAFHQNGTEVADGDANPGTIGPIAPRRSAESFGRTSPALYDVDGDGKLEILFGSKFQTAGVNEFFYALKADGSGANAPGWPKVLAPLSGFLASPTIADLDGDGTVEIIQQCENDSLYVWHPNGSRVPPFPVRYVSNSQDASSLAASVAVGDFDGDGKLDMVVVETVSATSSRIRIITRQNVTLPGWPVTVPNLSEASPVVGDIDGDAQLDVVWGTGGGSDSAPSFLYAWGKDGTDIDGFPIFLSGFDRSTATLCDLDGNGTVNIALASWDKLIHVWDMGTPYNPNRMPWPTFRGNVHRDGVFTTRVSSDAPPAGHPAGAPARPQLLGAVPNPFNPATTIPFDVPAGGKGVTRLRILDAAGRQVTTLVDAALPAGRHASRWDGRDAGGRLVSSGVFYAQLEVDGYVPVARKLTLIK